MHVAWLATEAFPFAKVGGLGDVVGSLPRALAKLGLDLTVYLPWYRGIEATATGNCTFHFTGGKETAQLGEIRHAGVRFVFVGLEDFDRPQLYGYDDDPRRFVRFALAAAECVDAELVHVHDWQGALLPVLAHAGRTRARRSLLTIHNLAYQGCCEPHNFFQWTQLPETYFDMQGLEFYGQVNLLKGGIVFADRVTTVSPSYAAEILTAEHGAGLHGTLRQHQSKLSGILNAIDVEYWDPAQDRVLPSPYATARDPGKDACRRALAAETSLAPPILGSVSRLVPQKGLDLVLAALPSILAQGCSIALLGSGEAQAENSWRAAAATHPGRVFFHSGYNEWLAHHIYAGSDAFLVPSRFEPCGLTQMIAQRYGTPPIARAVGGLRDTIDDGRTGILFAAATPEAVGEATARFRAIADPNTMADAGMQRDFSWGRSARRYADLYAELMR